MKGQDQLELAGCGGGNSLPFGRFVDGLAGEWICVGISDGILAASKVDIVGKIVFLYLLL